MPKLKKKTKQEPVKTKKKKSVEAELKRGRPAKLQAKRTGSRVSKSKNYGHVYGETVRTPAVRVAWPSLTKPKESPFKNEDGSQKTPPRYELTFLLPKDTKDTVAFLDNLESLKDEMVDAFNHKRPTKIQVDSLGVKDGDDFDLEKYPYYENHFVLIARNTAKPAVRGAKKDTVLEASEVQGGCLCWGYLTPLCTAHGISFKLEIVQLLKDDGQRFGGGRKAESLMEDYESGVPDEFKEEEEDEDEDTQEGSEEESADEGDDDSEGDEGSDDEGEEDSEEAEEESEEDEDDEFNSAALNDM